MDPFTAILVLVTVTVLFVLYSKWKYQYWTRKGVGQIEPELIYGTSRPIFRGLVPVQQHFLNYYRQGRARGLKHVGIYNILSPEWLPLDIDIVKRILTKDFSYFPDHGLYHHKSDLFSNHLFNLEGQEWKTLRMKLTPTFSSGKLKMMFETLLEKANILKKVVTTIAETEQEIPVKEIAARFTTDIIASVAFGIECNSLEETNNTFREIGKKFFEPNLFRVILEELVPHKLLGLTGYRTLPRTATAYFTEIVKETIEYRDKNNIQRKDLMQLMLQLRRKTNTNSDSKNQDDLYLTDDEILAESFVFYAAGFETSSSTTSNALLELAQNQDIQDKLRQEINDVLERHNGKVTYDAVMEMEYLDMVISEALRKYPPVSDVTRKCVKDYKLPGSDVVIKKGTKVHVIVWGIQTDPEYFPEPDKFNPDNFTPENKAKRPDFAWIPFGEGPRMCIGLRFGLMQSKVALVSLLKDFRFLPHEKTQYPVEFDISTAVLTVKGNIILKIEKIHN